MAESLKGTSSADPKEKGLLLDEATGKEFLSSWKSMSMIEDDVMNFSFDTVANGKKKAFNFEKLDMDFNLDGDFEKLTSFKVDMPDLDFSCPPKKTTKREEKSEEESSKFYKEKRDCFSFSFDFNELDGFNFDSSLTKQGEKASNNNQDDKGVASDRNKEQGPKLLQTKINGDSIITELPAPESMANSKQTKKGDPGVRNSINDSSHLNPATDASTSPEKRITTNYEETNPKSPLREKAMSRGECTLRTTQKLPLQSASGNYSNRDTLSDINAEVCSLGRKESSGVGHDVNIEMMAVMGTNHENLKTKGSSLLHITGSEKSKCEENDVGNDVPAEIMVETESVHGDLDLKDTPTTGLSGKALQETCGNQDVKNLTSLPLVRSGSELPLENLTLLEEKEAGAICSNLFRKTEETGSQFLQSSSAQQEVFSVGSKRLGPTCLNPANQNRSQSNSYSPSEEKTKVVTSTIKSPHNPMVFAVESLNNGKRMPNVSTSTISSMLRANDKPSSSTLQRNINSRTLKQNLQLPGNTVSKIAHSVGRTQRQTPLTPFLKRKTLEESNADLVSLQPLKRLSKSPSEIRNCTESSERVVEEKENCSEMRTKNIVSDQPTYGLEVSQEVNMMELEMPLIMENDDSVEKAEAYTKELEDICNMLRKKHEEAKEILVRAIVNNNNLLMLNHPIFEEKIREVQKFAAQLVSKELLT